MKLPTAKDWVVTQASFPEQDWSVWEAARFNHPGLGRTVDTGYLNVMPCCIHCATWICSGCWNFRRVRATRRADQYCARCGSREGFFSATRHGTRNPHGPHVPKLPFRVPRMISDDEARAARMSSFEEAIRRPIDRLGAIARVMSQGCPAGDPCPGTGCPACCPPYDPCSEKNCLNCNPPLSGTFVTPGGVSVPVTMQIKKYKDLAIQDPNRKQLWETEVHVPEEADMAKRLEADMAKKLTAEDLDETVYTEVQQPQMVEVLLAKIRHARENNRQMVSLNIEQAEELLALAKNPLRPTEYPYVDGDVDVLGPEVFLDADEGVISWRGENYYKAAQPVNVDEALQTRHLQMLRREAMQWAVEIQKAILASGNRADRPLVDTAETILEWLTRE